MSEDKHFFKDYNLKFELLRGLYSSGYEEPTNLQKKIITELSSSKDILVNSPSLTGKKISFIISCSESSHPYHETSFKDSFHKSLNPSRFCHTVHNQKLTNNCFNNKSYHCKKYSVPILRNEKENFHLTRLYIIATRTFVVE